MLERVFCVIVTYGNRFQLLRNVIDSALNECVHKIIVVDNNSDTESRQKLLEYEKVNQKIKVIYLNENIGSAGGYKIGLQEAYNDKDCSFIWLLDDDNQPQKNALKYLLKAWDNINYTNKNSKIALASYRENFKDYDRAIASKDPNSSLGRENSFFRFHIIGSPKFVLNLISMVMREKIYRPQIKTAQNKNSEIFITTAAYSGLFFHKDLITNIGYPKQDFFLYVDDTEWTYRITKSGGKIILVVGSKIKDIDYVYEKKSKIFSNIVISGQPDFRIYYLFRNRVIFELSERVNNRLIYLINVKIVMFFLKIFAKKENIEIAEKAVKDGFNNKIGKI